MSEKFYSLVTNIGKATIANSIGLGVNVNFVKMKVGDGGGAYYEPTEDQLDLKNVVWEGNITNVDIDASNPNWIRMEVIIPSNIGGFTIREYGAFDSNGDMLGICKCAETYKPVVADGSVKELLLTMILAVSNPSSINLKLDPTVVFAKKSDIEQIAPQVADLTSVVADLGTDRIYYCGVTNGINTYTVINSKITTITEGTTVRIKIGSSSTGASTLNINSLGAIPIIDSIGNPIGLNGLKSGLPYQLCYNGTSFVVLGKGSGGSALPSQIVLGKTATVDSGLITGTMDLSNLVSVNIKRGVTVNGVTGKPSVVETSDANATSAQILSPNSGYVNGNKIIGTMPTASYSNTPQGCGLWGNGDLAVYLAQSAYYKAGVGTNSSEIRVPIAQLQSAEPNLLASNIVGGKTIFGIAGGGSAMRTATGTMSITYPANTTKCYVDLSNVNMSKILILYIKGSASAYATSTHTSTTYMNIDEYYHLKPQLLTGTWGTHYRNSNSIVQYDINQGLASDMYANPQFPLRFAPAQYGMFSINVTWYAIGL